MNTMSRVEFPFGLIPKILNILAAAVSLIAAPSATAAYSVSQYGITWTWQEDRQVGQYANGDWWVVGPVTINSITPECVTGSATDSRGQVIQWTRNGTMVNPPPSYLNSAQGFDNSIYTASGWTASPWEANLNKAPAFTGKPLVVQAGSSIVSSVSKSTPAANTSQQQFTLMAILTVVSEVPASGAFRPSPTGNDKISYWNKSQLNYSILQKLAPVSGWPDLATVEGYFEKPWICFHEASSVQAMSASGNMPYYGRDQANYVSIGMLSLNLNYTNAQKEKLYIRLVQYGIDIYGAVKAGQIFTDNGGMNNGRKAPLVLAALALNDSGMLEWANGNKRVINRFDNPVQPFAEDSQTWVVTTADVGRYVDNSTEPRFTYTSEQVGLPEWGQRHTTFPAQDNSSWTIPNDTYRFIGASQLGFALAVRMISGGLAAWNHAPFFDYEDRFWSIESISPTWTGTNGINPFVKAMWQTYRNYGSSTTPLPQPPVYAIGNRIQLSNNANVRASSSLTGTLLGSQIQGATGTIIAGPVQADGFTWWQVNYDSGVDGWTGEDNFVKPAVSTSPSAPTGLKIN